MIKNKLDTILRNTNTHCILMIKNKLDIILHNTRNEVLYIKRKQTDSTFFHEDLFHKFWEVQVRLRISFINSLYLSLDERTQNEQSDNSRRKKAFGS